MKNGKASEGRSARQRAELQATSRRWKGSRDSAASKSRKLTSESFRLKSLSAAAAAERTEWNCEASLKNKTRSPARGPRRSQGGATASPFVTK
jgi:hypothetical protein